MLTSTERRYDRDRLNAARARGVSIRVTPPTAEPVDADLLKLHARLPDSNLDLDLLPLRLQAAREWVERYTNRALITQTWSYTVDGLCDWTAPLLLPVAPLIAVTSITATDLDDTATVVSSGSYRVETGDNARIVLDTDVGYWVASPRTYSTLSVVYTAGYGATADTVPAVFKHVIMLLASEFGEQLEAAVEKTRERVETPYCLRLLDPYVVYR